MDAGHDGEVDDLVAVNIPACRVDVVLGEGV
jgi:hypothetical protein